MITQSAGVGQYLLCLPRQSILWKFKMAMSEKATRLFQRSTHLARFGAIIHRLGDTSAIICIEYKLCYLATRALLEHVHAKRLQCTLMWMS